MEMKCGECGDTMCAYRGTGCCPNEVQEFSFSLTPPDKKVIDELKKLCKTTSLDVGFPINGVFVPIATLRKKKGVPQELFDKLASILINMDYEDK